MKITLFVLFSFIAFFSEQKTHAAPAWKRHTIDAAETGSGKLGADGVRLGDINGDGAPDVVTGWENGDAIRVCINPGPKQAKAIWPGVTVGHVAGAEDAVFADLDGDGTLDVVSSCEGKTKTVFFHWAPADRDKILDASEWVTTPVPVTEKKQSWMYALPYDVNMDGNIDLIIGSKRFGGSVSWLKNPGKQIARNMDKWQLIKICEAGWIMSIRKTDLNSDGIPEILFSDRKGPRSGVFLLPTKTKSPWFAEPVLLGCAGEEVMFLDLADLNDDGRQDIAVAIRPEKISYLYQPQEPFSTPWQTKSQAVDQTRFGTCKAVRIADLHLSGKQEAVITCEAAKGDLSGVLSLPRYSGSLRGKILATDISGSDGVKFDRMELLDLDADGDLDIMTCEESRNLGVFWYENPAKP